MPVIPDVRASHVRPKYWVADRSATRSTGQSVTSGLVRPLPPRRHQRRRQLTDLFCSVPAGLPTEPGS